MQKIHEEKNDHSSCDSDSCEEDYQPVERKINTDYLKKKRKTIITPNITPRNNYIPPTFPKTKEEEKNITDILSNILMFQNLSVNDMNTIVQAFEKCSFEKNDVIITQGDEGDAFYIIENGSVEVVINDVGKVMECANYLDNPNDSTDRVYFGELALLYSTTRKANVICTSDTLSCYKLDGVTFKSIIYIQQQQRMERNHEIINNINIFQGLSDYNKLILCDSLTPRFYHANDVIINENEEGHEFFIIESGEVKIEKLVQNITNESENKNNNESIEISKRLRSGDYFGELSLLHTNTVRYATVTAVEDTSVLVIDRLTFERVLGVLDENLSSSINEAVEENKKEYEEYIKNAMEQKEEK